MPSDDDWVCAAGRSAFFGGRWKLPCFLPTEHQHVLIAPEVRINLCDTHISEAIAAGHITDPYISEEGAEHLAKRR